MYAEHRYAPPKSRAISFGGAFLINGALIAGLIFAAPNVIPKGPEGGITVVPIWDPPIPDPVEPPKPTPDNRTAQTPRPNAPDPFIKTLSENTTTTTDKISEPVPGLPPVEDVGTFTEAPPPPVPPLLTAEQDTRYLKDFQPAYPSVELRAQRDGVVKLRVLIGIDGRVKAAESVSATSDAFFEATRRQALSKWRFKPATRGGVPQESWKTMSVRFLIKDQ